MPELIERGHLFIAQPPLYRAKRGNDERYLKDDRALEDFLIEKSLSDARMVFSDGTVVEGDELRAEANRLRETTARLRRLASLVPMIYLEQAAVAGALATETTAAGQAAQDLAQRLDAISLPGERGWVIAAGAEGLTMARTARGVAEKHTLDASSLRNADARWLADQAGALQHRFATPATLRLDSTEQSVTGPAAAYDRILAHGRKGLAIQRFKGLGEMNPDQLWKTTLDPASRTLLQVKVGDAEDASQIFSTLMGDVVEPRREFIVGNALKVANLDV
jgi:DNA gyrase subunit B